MAQQTYTTKSGDTLSGIASKYGVNIGDISGYKSGDINKIGIGENLTINTRDIPSPNTINADNLNATPYKTPTPVPKTGYAGLIESSNAVIKNAQKDVNSGATDIQDVYDKLGKISSNKADLYDTEGVYDKQKAYNDIVNTMNAKDLAYRRKIEKIRNENPTGQLSEGQNIAIANEERAWASEKADLAITAAFARDDYTLAKTIVDDKIAAETEDLKTELDGLKFFYSQNYDTLTSAQKSLLEQQTAQVETELNDKKQLLSDISNIQMEAAKNGAPATIITAIGKAGDVTTAIASAGQYIGLLDRMKATNSGGFNFSDSQISRGASNAGVSISQFKSFDTDTQNFFVNNDINSLKKEIDNAFVKDGSTLEEVQTAISSQNIPQKGADILMGYAITSQEKNAPTLDQYASKLQKDGMSRGEALSELTNYWSNDGKIDLKSTEKTDIKNAINKLYGGYWSNLFK